MAGQRPPHVKPPAHLSKSPPVPTPESIDKPQVRDPADTSDPTRFGDWVRKGIAVDF